MLKSRLRWLLVIGVTLVLAGSVYAFAASNTVPANNAGFGEAVVSGYTISNVAYSFGSDPNTLDQVAFDIAADAGGDTPTNVEVSLDGGTQWYDCVAGTLPNWTCDTTSPAVSTSSVVTLSVAASD